LVYVRATDMEISGSVRENKSVIMQSIGYSYKKRNGPQSRKCVSEGLI